MYFPLKSHRPNQFLVSKYRSIATQFPSLLIQFHKCVNTTSSICKQQKVKSKTKKCEVKSMLSQKWKHLEITTVFNQWGIYIYCSYLGLISCNILQHSFYVVILNILATFKLNTRERELVQDWGTSIQASACKLSAYELAQ